MDDYTRFVGLDVHKDTIYAAVAERGRAAPQALGGFPNTPTTLRRWLRRHAERWGSLEEVLFCYEAGPCGYVPCQQLAEEGAVCVVVAPTLVPRRPGDRVKTDRRDAQRLASLLRAGELTPVWVPDRAHEAFRGLLRAREAAVGDRTRARHRLSKFLLARGHAAPAGTNWGTLRHERWLDRVGPREGCDGLVFREQRRQVEELSQRIARYDAEIAVQARESRWAPLIGALMCLRGVALIGAATLCAELGDIARFTSAPQLMSYAGLVPGEASSGAQTRHLGITKAGNAHLRRVLVEAAWSYRHPPKVGEALARRQRGQPPEVLAISWRGQTRLHGRYRRLRARGKERNRVIVAVARELLGFVWEVWQAVAPADAPSEGEGVAVAA